MTSEPQNLPAVQSDSNAQGADQSRLATSNQSQKLSLYQSQTSPLPGNRPIADNVTEDIDDMLGYLD
jgi:hypothetical protein